MKKAILFIAVFAFCAQQLFAGSWKMNPHTGKLDYYEKAPQVCVDVMDGAESIVPGPPGPAGGLTIGTTTTGAPGTNASVVNTGSFSNAILGFTIPRGDTGATGATGATGSAGIGANALFCNISGAVRTVTYAADGTTPYPSALSSYVVQLWNGATRILADTWLWWTGGESQRVYGSSTASSFTPSLKSVFSHISSNNYIAVQVRYSSAVGKRYCVTGIPIPATKIGTTGATGASGSGGGASPGGALNSIQYMYSSASTKKVLRGFGKYEGGALIL